jgi:hypothetical protein
MDTRSKAARKYIELLDRMGKMQMPGQQVTVAIKQCIDMARGLPFVAVCIKRDSERNGLHVASYDAGTLKDFRERCVPEIRRVFSDDDMKVLVDQYVSTRDMEGVMEAFKTQLGSERVSFTAMLA